MTSLVIEVTDSEWTNISDELSLAAGVPLTAFNKSGFTNLFCVTSPTEPTEIEGMPIWERGQQYIDPGNDNFVWMRAVQGKAEVYATTEAVSSSIPSALVTSSVEPYGRVRVDVGQTGFFEGREFRTFYEWPVATTGVYILKATTTVDTILMELGGNLVAGEIRIAPIGSVTGTAGDFSITMPIIRANTMLKRPQPYYSSTSTIVMGIGITVTGGIDGDVTYGKVGSNVNFSGSISGTGGEPRGSAPGIYYYRITLTDVIGVLKARWEERP